MMDYIISNLVSAKTFRLHYNVDLNPALRAESLRNMLDHFLTLKE